MWNHEMTFLNVEPMGWAGWTWDFRILPSEGVAALPWSFQSRIKVKLIEGVKGSENGRPWLLLLTYCAAAYPSHGFLISAVEHPNQPYRRRPWTRSHVWESINEVETRVEPGQGLEGRRRCWRGRQSSARKHRPIDGSSLAENYSHFD